MPYPQLAGKHREKALFSPVEFHRYVWQRRGGIPPRVPPNIVLLFGRRWGTYLDRRYPGTRDARTDVYRVAPGTGVTLLGGPGAPWASIVVEELAALGARRFVIVGTAGSLQPDLRAGSFVVCRAALRDEGTSHHYLGPGRFVRASPGLARALRRAFERERVPHAVGDSWTIDAPYRETRAEIRRYRSQGVLTVEMEASAAFSVARYRRLEAGAVFVVSDHLDDAGWEPRFHDTSVALRRALDLVVAALRSRGRAAPRLRRVAGGRLAPRSGSGAATSNRGRASRRPRGRRSTGPSSRSRPGS